MSITKEQKVELITKFGKNSNDSGSVEPQIAILTKEILVLIEHMKKHKKDFSSRKGLIKKVSQRKSLLKYLMKNDINRYQKIVKELNFRK